jgi:flagellar assembly factor FliW
MLGEVEAREESVRYFADGLMGYESLKRYALVELPEYQPFLWMVSVDDPRVVFALASPQLFYPGRYEVPLGDADRDVLDLQSSDVVSVFVVVSCQDGGRKLTANLKGPVAVNERNRLGKQVVIYNPAYSVRQPWLGPVPPREPAPTAVATGRGPARG